MNVLEEPISILIVDDQPTNLKLLRVRLQGDGYIVYEASDGVKALSVLENHKVEAIISDILMPNMDGYEFCANIRRNKKYDSVAFIFYTATYTSAGDEEFALKLGADRFFKKPSPVQTILDSIHSIRENAKDRILSPINYSNETILREYSHSLVEKLEEQNMRLIEQNNKLNFEMQERKKAEDESIRQKYFFKLLFDVSPIGLAILDTENRLITANKTFQEMFQFTEESLKGKDLCDYIVPASSLNEAKLLMQKAPSGAILNQEVVLKRHDERILQVTLHIFPFIVDSQTTAICEIFIDRTKERSLEKQLREAQKMETLGNFSSGIAHDFNNILSIISGHAFLLQSKREDQKQIERCSDAIQKGCERGAGIVRQLLTFSRKTDTVFGFTNINTIAEEIRTFLVETIPKTIRLNFQLEKNLPAIKCDATQIHQLLLNLSINARDAMPDGGTLTITTQIIEQPDPNAMNPKLKYNRYVTIRVSDTGIGMDERTKERVFEPFFTTKQAYKGTGLGLSVVYGIVENHEGLIEIDSTLSVGTTFSIFLPVKKNVPELIVPVLKEGSPSLHKRKGFILFIEDEEMLRSLIYDYLTPKGYQILLARDGEEGLDIYRKYQTEISIVISDLGLPYLGGEEVVRKILSIGHDVKLVVASGFIGLEVKERILRDGPVEFIQKPYRLTELLELIEQEIQVK
ncbi:PAS domain S-box protein [Leptospira broomii serovar Hurstbridge str. 5399]|uniref:histidine kinase n=1 Tax=Leptospira broomii serovar Hurstbridge str. 5399 TaxID=1049789 RepID=T0GIJ2_9LEPT|nr:response regulator [Leptospira broomii]EQA46639.1 PAS domain S-box protein [Leptospira broomii serovar Hurstbridge str. 5399]